jgi:hypothetical protein
MLAVNAVQLGVVMLAGVGWEKLLSDASLLHLSGHVSPGLGGASAYESQLLRRLFQQIHRSPRRLEVIRDVHASVAP